MKAKEAAVTPPARISNHLRSSADDCLGYDEEAAKRDERSAGTNTMSSSSVRYGRS
eukprot:CAMPEP_0178527214 /NCGR_PEP_ID=MMETSP0696-20121128/31144_1 /TAXON_ID=265572 /ORGANISM="Extubocellulus spinifer, Strain CCMP396" /LENGTH=55 /DNA_ID=CAMNT_0020158775 /DNA_START=43 /DNA_END=207 /DNA_ORIENTATION=+